MTRSLNWSRRDALRMSMAGLLGASGSAWMPQLAASAAGDPSRRRSCILLWMTGGPSQLDTFDLKPGHENGGPFKPIDTDVPGVQISEHLPQLAREMKDIAVIRSMNTKEGDHARATYFLRTGYLPQGPIQFPSLGSSVSKQLADESLELPAYVSISPYQFFNQAAYGSGFLGPKYSPLVVGGNGLFQTGQPNADYADSLRVKNLKLPGDVTREKADTRLDLLGYLERDFQTSRGGAAAASHRSAYEKATRLMRGEAARAFDVDEEPDALRDAYGRNPFGQGCLLARRLVERGVPFVEVSLTQVPGVQTFGWDTHVNNFDGVKSLCSVLDPGWAALMRDLRDRGLLESTLVVWMGEFGRTPKINQNQGRDHFPSAWTTVLGGGGIRGGQTIGRTSPDGMSVDDRPVATPDLIATICRALGLDPSHQNMSNVGRPIRLADPAAQPIEEALA